ncbi:autophagocytosis associated protein, putative [Eimeria praecox]|uniref:Autophagocytosis associated protein, putative n=1 Tax=Eimeria praecox TaxID=51316 RepID=U6GLR9_9EIME|nr:autophagocytosis associated protein, putative [Eimeria praecox]
MSRASVLFIYAAEQLYIAPPPSAATAATAATAAAAAAASSAVAASLPTPLVAPAGSNVSHRLADLGRSLLSRLSFVPQTSQFVDKGTMTPQEFIDAGDLLVFKFPTWQWEPAVGKRVNSWLPPDKQFLVTRGVACHRRVRDIEASLNAEAREEEGWVLPIDADPEELQGESAVSLGGSTDRQTSREASTGDGISSLPEPADDPACAESSTSYFVRQAPDADVLSVRTYDLSITYDKYFQTPRLWLFGYNESGTPLTPAEIFEDILTDYAAKTVTVDPHPCTGVPTASIHPCKHAQVMKKVVDHWRSQGVEPR